MNRTTIRFALFIFIAGILLYASALKTLDVITATRSPVDQWDSSIIATLFLAEIELILAIIAISTWSSERSRWILFAAFSVFTIVSAIQWANGARSCGCFGETIRVPPERMIVLDIALGLLLIGVGPSTSSRSVVVMEAGIKNQ